MHVRPMVSAGRRTMEPPVPKWDLLFPKWNRRAHYCNSCRDCYPLELAAFEQVVKPANSVPAVAIGFEADAVFALLVCHAVVAAQQVNQAISCLALQARRERDLS